MMCGVGEVRDVICGIQEEILEGKFEDAEMYCEFDLGRERKRNKNIIFSSKIMVLIYAG
jgi:hypothetical protein